MWPVRLRDELMNAAVVLALIGPDWLMATDEWNRRRIDSASDWVRQEIKTALDDPDKLLIPVLLDGAALPPKEALPTDLAGLADRQARVLNHETWRWQLDALVADIQRHTKWDRSGVSVTAADAILGHYAKAQLRRVETILRTNGPTTTAGMRNGVDPATELVVPDLLPFQVDQPATDGLTMDAAAHLRRAARDRARYSAKEMLSGSNPNRVVIVGGPGSGKTTLMSMLTRAHAMASIADAMARTPVLLRVRDLSVRSGDSLTADIARDACRWLDLQADRDFIDGLFTSGRGLLIVDGVDEAPSVSSRNELLAKIDLFAGKYECASIVVSSRIVGYDPRVLGQSFEHYELAPFSEQQVRQVLASGVPSEPDHPIDIDKLAKRIVSDRRLSALAETPLLLAIVVRIVVERGTADWLPRERHSLYDVAVDMMLSEWDSQRGIETAEWPSHLEHSEIRLALETVAYRIQAGLVKLDDTTVVDSATFEYELATALEAGGVTDTHRARRQARDLLRYAVSRAGLLVESGPGRFAFCHRVIQEHLAACAISARARGPSSAEPIVAHLAEHGLHAPEWRNVNLLLLGMQRGDRARRVIEYALQAGSAYEQWLHRDLLFIGEVLGESPALVASLTGELGTRIVSNVLDICTVNRFEVGFAVAQAVDGVLRSWRDTSLADVAHRCLGNWTEECFRDGRYWPEALIGSIDYALDVIVDRIVSGDTPVANQIAIAARDFGVDFRCSPSHVEAVINSIPARVSEREAGVERFRLPYTAAEVAGLLAKGTQSHNGVRQTYLAWINNEMNPVCLRGAAATGLGWLRDNSTEVREALLSMLLGRHIAAGDRTWPAYALFRLGGGESEVVAAMLTILDGDAPILSGWAQAYLYKFATRSAEVVVRLRELAEDDDLSTLPWVLAACARLSGLKSGQIGKLKSIAVSDTSIRRRVGAIETLVQCAETTPDWRQIAAQKLVDTLELLLVEAPTEENVDDVSTSMYALGSLRVSSPQARRLCLRFLRHESEGMRIAATYGIGGLPVDAQACTEIVAILSTLEVTGRVRGGLVDALHRVLASDWL